ncbi:MAG: aminodeoxychorismate/anthranilate synthase component II, partial [Patescibacteria group bacterium]
MKILIIDNYDSFTFNLYQYVGEILNAKKEKLTLDVVRNDEITIQEIAKRKYEKIIISPGPGDPSDSQYFGVCAKVLTEIGKQIPVLGVCLGMQGMAYYF